MVYEGILWECPYILRKNLYIKFVHYVKKSKYYVKKMGVYYY